jgi:DNA-binding GntR family transcriptional regulator
MSEKEPAPRFQTKSAYAASVLRKALAEGRFVAGQRLLATQLARDLGLSMTPVREALMQLAHDGLVEIAPHRGVRVADIPLADLADTYVVRAILESAAAKLAARRMRPEEIAQLRSIHAKFVKAVSARSPDVARLRELNEEFHFIIYAAAGSSLLRRMIRTAWTSSPRDTFGVLPLKTAKDDHGELIDALEAGEGDRAEELMREHIEEAAKVLRRFKKGKRKQ